MSFTITNRYHAHVIHIQKKFLGSVERTAWKAALEGLGKSPRIIIDLSQTDFMDSSAVGLLIGTAKSVREEGGEVVLANLKKRIKNLLLMMHLLGDVFTNYETIEAAEHHFVAAAE